MKQYKIGDYICTLYGGFSMDGKIVGKHGDADFYAVQLNGGPVVYRWTADMLPSIPDHEFVEEINKRFAN